MNHSLPEDEREWVVKTVKTCDGSLHVNQIELLGEGWRSRAYLVNGDLVFRFPKAREGAVDTKKEIDVLAEVASYITLNIPKFIFIGEQD